LAFNDYAVSNVLEPFRGTMMHSTDLSVKGTFLRIPPGGAAWGIARPVAKWPHLVTLH